MELSTDHINDARYQFLPFSETIQRGIEKSPKNKKLQERIDRLTALILEKNPVIWWKYQFIVFRSDAMQIMHTRWGKIFIPDALVNLTKNDATLVFILSHEIAHWENDIKNDKVNVYSSQWEIYEAECAADAYAWKVSRILWYDEKYISKFLRNLEKKSLRPKYDCVDEE